MLFGCKEKIEIFKKLISNDGLSHAYLFFGEPQVGKFTFAKSLAYFLEYGEPFDTARDKPLIDFQEILPDPEKGTIGIDTARQIKNFLFQKPFRSKKRLVLIDQAQVLTVEAQGALLKIVEEPPPSALLILIVNESSVLLPPLLSRLTKVYFSRFPQKELEQILISRYKVSKERAKNITKESFGRIGRALSLLAGRKTDEADQREESFEVYLSRLILRHYLRDKFRHSGVINWLLIKEWQANTFNLNPNLQRKAVSANLHESVTNFTNNYS
jgi:DNA polymerase-3 subunit delta'